MAVSVVIDVTGHSLLRGGAQFRLSRWGSTETPSAATGPIMFVEEVCQPQFPQKEHPVRSHGMPSHIHTHRHVVLNGIDTSDGGSDDLSLSDVSEDLMKISACVSRAQALFVEDERKMMKFGKELARPAIVLSSGLRERDSISNA